MSETTEPPEINTRRQYRSSYEYTRRFGRVTHTWKVVGGRASMHLHITESARPMTSDVGDKYYGGLEIHWRVPPWYQRNDAPDHDVCPLNHAPCWHDGSSLVASEVWIPRWLRDPHDHDELLRALERNLSERIEEVEEEEKERRDDRP